jgi:hypothetical protein
MLYKNSVRTSKRTPHFTITKINWLTLFKFNPCTEVQKCGSVFIVTSHTLPNWMHNFHNLLMAKSISRLLTITFLVARSLVLRTIRTDNRCKPWKLMPEFIASKCTTFSSLDWISCSFTCFGVCRFRNVHLTQFHVEPASRVRLCAKCSSHGS